MGFNIGEYIYAYDFGITEVSELKIEQIKEEQGMVIVAARDKENHLQYIQLFPQQFEEREDSRDAFYIQEQQRKQYNKLSSRIIRKLKSLLIITNNS